MVRTRPSWSATGLAATVGLLAGVVLPACARRRPTADWLADLASRDPYTRLVAATAVGHQEVDDALVETTLARLDAVIASDRDERVRERAREARRAVASRACDEVLRLVCTEPDRETEARRLVEFGPGAIPRLSSALGSSDCPHGDTIAHVLAALGEPAVPALVVHFERGTTEGRRRALLALGEMGAAGRDALPHVLDELDGELREPARDCLARIARGLSGGRVTEIEDPELGLLRALVPWLCEHPDDVRSGLLLQRLARGAPEELVAALPAGDCPGWHVVGRVLGSLGEPADRAVTAALQGHGNGLRAGVVAAGVRRLRSAEAVLRQVAEGDDAELAAAARVALERLRE